MIKIRIDNSKIKDNQLVYKDENNIINFVKLRKDDIQDNKEYTILLKEPSRPNDIEIACDIKDMLSFEYNLNNIEVKFDYSTAYHRLQKKPLDDFLSEIKKLYNGNSPYDFYLIGLIDVKNTKDIQDIGDYIKNEIFNFDNYFLLQGELISCTIINI